MKPIFTKEQLNGNLSVIPSVSGFYKAYVKFKGQEFRRFITADEFEKLCSFKTLSKAFDYLLFVEDREYHQINGDYLYLLDAKFAFDALEDDTQAESSQVSPPVEPPKASKANGGGANPLIFSLDLPNATIKFRKMAGNNALALLKSGSFSYSCSLTLDNFNKMRLGNMLMTMGGLCPLSSGITFVSVIVIMLIII